MRRPLRRDKSIPRTIAEGTNSSSGASSRRSRARRRNCAERVEASSWAGSAAASTSVLEVPCTRRAQCSLTLYKHAHFCPRSTRKTARILGLARRLGPPAQVPPKTSVLSRHGTATPFDTDLCPTSRRYGVQSAARDSGAGNHSGAPEEGEGRQEQPRGQGQRRSQERRSQSRRLPPEVHRALRLG